MTITTNIKKLIFGGQGLAHHDGTTVMIWGGLPDETVEVAITKTKPTFMQGYVTKVITPSPDRIAAQEPHFMSCSPWQIMTPASELSWKQKILAEVWHQHKLTLPSAVDMIDTNQPWAYRNKMEYSFALDNDQIKLAFFDRGTKKRYPINPCMLAHPTLNSTAQIILDWINAVKIPYRSCKSLVVRSNLAGQTLAALFLKDQLSFPSLPDLPANNLGLQIYYSTHKSPASIPTKLLHKIGQTYITETINETELRYGALNFFQINIPCFIKAINAISQHIQPNTNLIDFYAGVGAISLPLHKNINQARLIETNQEAVSYAQDNIINNNINNFNTQCIPAEKIADLITNDKTLIVDPPRAGLHPDIIKKIREVKPPLIIYLSCNITTQARDLALLQDQYQLDTIKLFNFFPRTPHMECLCILVNTHSK